MVVVVVVVAEHRRCNNSIMVLPVSLRYERGPELL